MRRYILLLAVLVGVILPAVPNLRQAAMINLWSLRYAAEMHDRPRSQDALSSPPDAHPRAVFWRALGAIDGGDGYTALALLEPLSAEGDRMALQAMGRAYEVLGDFSAATRIWRRTETRYALGRVAEAATEEGRLDDALEAYRALWEVDPGEGTGLLAGFLWREKGDLAAAEAVWRQSVDAYPRSRYRPGWLRQLADLLGEQGRWLEAGEVYEQYTSEYPKAEKIDEVTYDLAWAYHMGGETEKAIAAIEQALRLAPDELRFRLRAGQIYESAGETDRALAAYRQVLSKLPDNKTALEALERLTGDQ